jgi:ribosome-binding factor A
MPSQTWHLDRLREDFHREIALAIANSVRDPRVLPGITVTEVKLAPDTRNATVLISLFADEKVQNEALAGLNAAAPYIQRIVAGKIKVKHIPHLYFKLDSALERGEHLYDLFKEIKNELD